MADKTPPDDGAENRNAVSQAQRRRTRVFSEGKVVDAPEKSTQKARRKFETFSDESGSGVSPPLPESISGQSTTAALPLTTPVRRPKYARATMVALLSILICIFGVELARVYDYLRGITPLLGTLWLIWLGLVSASVTFMWWHGVRHARSLQRAEAFRAEVQAHLLGHNFGNTAAFQVQLLEFYDGSPQADLLREALKTLPDCANDNEVVQHLEKCFMAKLDKKAIEAVSANASRNGVMIALSPWPMLDMILCFSNCMKMITQIAKIYGLQPSLVFRFQLLRRILSALVLAAGTEAMMDNILEEGGLATLSSFSLRAGQGVGVGMYTARMGCYAISACRPFPFDQCAEPKLRDLLLSLVSKLRGF